ncbi:MAG: sodium:proton antiporter NhaD [Bacteroidetes bacterium]|nr:sodium:proton antiporter NhaD [Bacteroidota bacterium]
MTALIIIIFTIGYFAVAFEHKIKINKTAPALMTGVLCWTVYMFSSIDKQLVSEQLYEDLGEFSGILFFLMGAMTIVEIIDLHDGFHVVTEKITQTNKRRLLWIISGITFFLSPVLDNLTTAIVMVSMLQKIVEDPKERLYFVGMIVIAANAGGAWSPIGDVTTTMLWLGGQITAGNIIKVLFIPSVISVVVPLLIVSRKFSGNVSKSIATSNGSTLSRKQQLIILITGISVLILVPVFKTVTHLPPYMGILIGLAIMWVIAERIGSNKEEQERFKLSPAYALRKIDTASILFFLGILLSIAALERTGILHSLAQSMEAGIANKNVIVLIMGMLSSIVDNVPLMAAAQGMYPLSHYPTDDALWEFLAYCTGTGGSILIIGSAAGVAVMGMANVNFFWYMKRISWIALIGYISGAISFILIEVL